MIDLLSVFPEHMPTPAKWAVLLVFGLWLVWLVLRRFFRTPSGFEPKPLLTKNEQEFYGRLERALPDLYIFPQVAFRALMRPRSPSSSRAYTREFSLIGSKHCDFLVCRKDFSPVVIIELDDRTHSAERDEKRDAMTANAGYVTLRYQSSHRPSIEEIRADVRSWL
ncbi:MAG: DUF2726 domain-containing protein [Alcaligenaceae bacterium]|nr:DUF2726 domain-containing protein [Alcaligenaceae bacterium]